MMKNFVACRQFARQMSQTLRRSPNFSTQSLRRAAPEQETKEMAKKAVNETKATAQKVEQETKEMAKKAANETKATAQKVTQETKKVFNEARQGTKEAFTDARQNVNKHATNIKKNPIPATTLFGATLAAAGAYMIFGSYLSADSGRVKESSTGIEFEEIIDSNLPTEFKKLTLAATACRFKYGLIKVYAVGIYTANPFVSSVEKDTAYELLLSGESQIVIKMNRDVDNATLVEALEAAIRPRVLKKDSTQMSSVDSFRANLLDCFEDRTVHQGQEIAFSCKKGSPLVIKVDQKRTKVQCSETLLWALLDTYVGKESIIPGFPSDVIKGMAQSK